MTTLFVRPAPCTSLLEYARTYAEQLRDSVRTNRGRWCKDAPATLMEELAEFGPDVRECGPSAIMIYEFIVAVSVMYAQTYPHEEEFKRELRRVVHADIECMGLHRSHMDTFTEDERAIVADAYGRCLRLLSQLD